MRIWLALTLILASAAPAEAAPVAAAVAAISSAVSTFAASSALAGFLVRTVASMALSQLAAVVLRKDAPKRRAPGIKTDATTSGGITPQSFVVGRFATGGQMIAPPNTQGQNGDTPRAWLVYPIALSVVPGCSVERVIVNDEYVQWQSSVGAWGVEASGALGNHCSIDFEDGSQTAAHAGMLTVFGSDPDRPWLADMVGPGTCVAYMRFKYNRELFNGLPSVRFEVLGIPLYDPREDSTVGGSGPQRWNDRSTWTQTENLIVIAYNCFRGIDVGAGMVWGGECDAEDLPLSNWFAAMNACDVSRDDGNGGTVPMYRGGFEIGLDDEPASVIEELLKACCASVVEVGGVWKVRPGAPALPSYFLTDDDLIISRDQEQSGFPGISGTYNGITATYVEPASLWGSKEAPPRYNPDWEEQDGQLEYDDTLAEWVIRPRRLLASLDIPACPYVDQVQVIMDHMVADHRRMTTQRIALPPEALVLEPLETVSWTSEQYGYGGKVFEITSQTDSLMTLIQGMALRERDPSDYGSVIQLPVAPSIPGTTPTPAQSVPGFVAEKWQIVDGSATARRAAVRISWTPEEALDARGILWEIRRASSLGAAELTGTHAAIESGSTVISEGILGGTAYAVRARLIVDRAVDWTGWVTVTTDAIGFSMEDLGAEIEESFREIAAEAGVESVSALPTSGNTNQIVFNLADNRLYRWTGTAWSPQLYAGIEAGSLNIAAFAAGIEPLTIVPGSTLPTVKSTSSIFFGGKLYRWNGAAYIATIPAGDVSGQITSTQIADDAITTPKLAAGAVTANELAANSVVAGKIAAAAVSTDQLAANAVTASKVRIGDTSNLVPDPEYYDYAQTGEGWQISALPTFSTSRTGTNANYGQASLLLIRNIPAGAAGWTWLLSSKRFEVRVGEDLNFSVGMWTDVAATMLVRVSYYNASDAQIGYLYALNGATGTGVVMRSASGAVPAGTVYARVQVYVDRSVSQPSINLGRCLVLRRMTGELIVDGAVTAEKISAGAVETDKLAASAVIASKIAAGAVTANKILVDNLAAISANLGTIQVGSANIANLAVSTIKIADAAISNFYATSAAASQHTGTGGDRALAALGFTANAGDRVLLLASYRLTGSGNNNNALTNNFKTSLQYASFAEIPGGSRDATNLTIYEVGENYRVNEYVTSVMTYDITTTGSHTYQLRTSGSGGTIFASNVELAAIRFKK